MKTLEEKIKALPPEFQRGLEDSVEFPLEKSSSWTSGSAQDDPRRRGEDV